MKSDQPSLDSNDRINRREWFGHASSTIALMICILAHSYLLISVFPYSGFMAKDLIPGLTEETVGSYAGLIASSFMVGRTVSSISWGKFADTYGRVPVLQISLAFSALFALLFGLAPTFGFALAVRFLLGLSNGILSTTKTLVSELARGDEALEMRSMGLVIGCWGWGFLFSPALGGMLAEPLRQYPNTRWFLPWEQVLAKFPFLLPNIVGVAFCVVAFVVVGVFVEETLPIDKKCSFRRITRDAINVIAGAIRSILVQFSPASARARTSSIEEIYLRETQNGNVRCGENGTCYSSLDACGVDSVKMNESDSCCLLAAREDDQKEVAATAVESRSSCDSECHELGQQKPCIYAIWKRKETRLHLIAYWIASFVVTCIDEAFPLFCMSKAGGLGLSEASIGKILSVSGFIFVICQYFTYVVVADRFGLYPSLLIGIVAMILCTITLPLSIPLDSGSFNDRGQGITTVAFMFLSAEMALIRVFGSVYFSSMSIACNRTVPPSQRGTMNGLSVLGGSVAKALAPAFAGLLVASSLSCPFLGRHFGATVVFSVIGAIGLVVLAVTLMLGDDEKVKNVLPVEKKSKQ